MCFDVNAEPPIEAVDDTGSRGEDIVLTSSDGTRFAAYAGHAGRSNGAAIVILPDVRGLFRFYKQLALRFAEAGVEAVAIDYFGRTAGLTARDDDFDFMPHVMQTRIENINADTAAAMTYLETQSHAPYALFTVGFCFGGSSSFLQAASQRGLSGVIGFYGNPVGPTRNDAPAPVDLASQFTCPVLGLFGGGDAHITADKIAAFEEALSKANINHELITYPGAPHSFFDRFQEQYAKESSDSWQRILGFTNQYTAVKA